VLSRDSLSQRLQLARALHVLLVKRGRKYVNDMNIRGPQTEGNTALRDDSDAVDLLPCRGTRNVPEKPTLDMLTSGSLAGGVSVETAWNIWQAMLKMAP
jgi:hypothetical protein